MRHRHRIAHEGVLLAVELRHLLQVQLVKLLHDLLVVPVAEQREARPLLDREHRLAEGGPGQALPVLFVAALLVRGRLEVLQGRGSPVFDGGRQILLVVHDDFSFVIIIKEGQAEAQDFVVVFGVANLAFVRGAADVLHHKANYIKVVVVVAAAHAAHLVLPAGLREELNNTKAYDFLAVFRVLSDPPIMVLQHLLIFLDILFLREGQTYLVDA